jgi:hypothetical protein
VFAVERRQRSDRRLAATPDGGEDGPFGLDGRPRVRVIEPTDRRRDRVIRPADLDREGALAGGRRHSGRIERLVDAHAETEPGQASDGEDSRGDLARIEAMEPCVNVARQRPNVEIGTLG